MQAIARRAAAPIFALALFSSAALIFVLQPLFGRMVTPLLGGSPAVWNTAMAFFQAALLAGYLYAHLVARLSDLRLQALVHAVVLATAWLVLPVHVSGMFGGPSSEHPALWLVGVLTVSVGAPFAAASATAPLLQAWYARTGRADAHDPYYLYAASNLGSFIGLLAYPVMIEPTLGAHAQSLAWSAGYVLVAGLIAVAAAAAIAANGDKPATPKSERSAPLSWNQKLYWMAAAAVPSALSLGVTLHILTDVASAPMLWVAPLALYLATFVIAFARGSERLEPAALFVHPIALALLLASYYASGNWLGSIAGILGGFFFSALICHLALSRTRPPADRLTEFYLYVSLGGVLGGAFAALAAPAIFNNVYEYPLALAAAALFRPRRESDAPRLTDAALAASAAIGVMAILLDRLAPLDSAMTLGALGAAGLVIAAGWGGAESEEPSPIRYGFLAAAGLHALLIIGVAFNIDSVFEMVQGEERDRIVMHQPWAALMLVSSLFMLGYAVHGTMGRRRANGRVSDLALGWAIPPLVFLILLVVASARLNAQLMVMTGILFCGLAVFFNRGRPLALAAITLIAFVVIFLDDVRGGRVITQERSFFGVLRTRVLGGGETPALRVLLHGTTIHGAQLTAPGLTRQPLTYYHPQTALGEAILGGLSLGDSSSLALIGLGAGSTACLTRPEDDLVIFEIDPAVVRLSAREGGDFTFVPECQPEARVVVGDARLRIADEPDGAFDVIVVDAFSSDAIPAHLLTQEALALYLAKTSERGIVVLHLSNRNLALVSEALRVARELNAPTLYRLSNRVEGGDVSFYGGLAASVMIVARSPETLARLPLPSNDWRVVAPPPGRAWSDDYINVARALWENLTGAEQCRIFVNQPNCPDDEAGAAGAAASH